VALQITHTRKAPSVRTVAETTTQTCRSHLAGGIYDCRTRIAYPNDMLVAQVTSGEQKIIFRNFIPGK